MNPRYVYDAFPLDENADPNIHRKKHLDYGSETTSFRVTESTRDGCTAKNSGARRLCEMRREADDDEPTSKRRQTKSPETGLDASTVGRIIFRNLGRCA